jgi:hypothetical protein
MFIITGLTPFILLCLFYVNINFKLNWYHYYNLIVMHPLYRYN